MADGFITRRGGSGGKRTYGNFSMNIVKSKDDKGNYYSIGDDNSGVKSSNIYVYDKNYTLVNTINAKTERTAAYAFAPSKDGYVSYDGTNTNYWCVYDLNNNLLYSVQNNSIQCLCGTFINDYVYMVRYGNSKRYIEIRDLNSNVIFSQQEGTSNEIANHIVSNNDIVLYMLYSASNRYCYNLIDLKTNELILYSNGSFRYAITALPMLLI